MRIITGFLKGKKINFINSPITRPLRDLVKENIFNVILHSNLINVDLLNSKILDLYSGVGSFGIECISRGAKNITFVEKNKFEIIFLDPPFAESTYINELESIKSLNLCVKKHLIIVHRERKTNDNLSKILKIISIKNYGRSKIIFGSFLT